MPKENTYPVELTGSILHKKEFLSNRVKQEGTRGKEDSEEGGCKGSN